MPAEFLATEFLTTLSGNGGSITSGATTFNVANSLPSGLQTPFRATIYASGATTGEVVLVTSVSSLAWTVTRGQETSLGAPAAASHNDGDNVVVVLTAQGFRQATAWSFQTHAAMIAAKKGYAQFSNAGDVLPKGSAAKTFEWWGRMNGDPGSNDLYFFMTGPNSSAGNTWSALHNGNASFAPNLAVNDGGTLRYVTQYVEWNDSNWHHYVLTYAAAATSAFLWVDGIQSSSITLGAAQNIAASTALYIGNYSGALLGTAFVAEFAVYSGVLSSTRIAAHYAERMTGQYSTAVLADSPIVYYRFADAGAGTTMADSSGNSNSGTYSNTFTPNSSALNFCYLVPPGCGAVI